MKNISLLLLVITSASAQAAVTCDEKITSLFNHGSGTVYFQTDKTCVTNWCSMGPSSDFAKRAFAQMQLSQVSGAVVQFYWPDISACTSQNVSYAVPGYLNSKAP